MIALFVRDIVEGIGRTGVRAGMLKCAIGRQGLTPGVDRVMRAVAKAHHATGTPITVHTHSSTRSGLEVKRVLCDEEGVAAERILLAHCGDTTDLAHLCELAELGFTLGMDRFGNNVKVTFEARANTVIDLCRRGYAPSIVLSHDASCYMDWMEPEDFEGLTQWNYLHIGEEVLPYVRQRGVTEEQIDVMLRDNPQRFFASALSAHRAVQG